MNSPTIVFHPDLPAPRPSALGSSGKRANALEEVAAAGEEADAAGNIYVCIGTGAASDGLKPSKSLLSPPQLCYLSFDVEKKASGDDDDNAAHPFANADTLKAIENGTRNALGGRRRDGVAAKTLLTIRTIVRNTTEGGNDNGIRQDAPTTSERNAATVRSGSSNASYTNTLQEGPYEIVPSAAGRSALRAGGGHAPKAASSSSSRASSRPHQRKPFNSSVLVEGSFSKANSNTSGKNSARTTPFRSTTPTSNNNNKAAAVSSNSSHRPPPPTTASSSSSAGLPIGMRTAARAASRARQDAQLRDVAVPDEAHLKASKREYLSQLGHHSASANASAAAAVGVDPRSHPARPRRDTSQPRGGRSGAVNSGPAAAPSRIVVELPCEHLLLNPNTVLLKKDASTDVILSFTKADTMASVMALLDVIRERSGTASAAAAISNNKQHSADPFTESSFYSDAIPSASALRETLTDTRFRYISNDLRPLSPSRQEDAIAAEMVLAEKQKRIGMKSEWAASLAERDASIMAGHLGGEATLRGGGTRLFLAPAGREPEPTDVVTESSLAPSTTALSTQMTPAQRRERHWQVMKRFDTAHDALVRYEEARRRDVDRLFEERDRRREAFLRKRSMLRETVVIPPEVLLTLQGFDPSSSSTVSAADAQTGAAAAVGLDTSVAKARDANWEAFAYMADALGRKWEEGGNAAGGGPFAGGGPINVDALLNSQPSQPQPQSAFHVDPLANTMQFNININNSNSPPRAMSPDAVMRSQMAMHVVAGGGGGGSPSSAHDPYLKQYAPDLAAMMAREEEAMLRGGGGGDGGFTMMGRAAIPPHGSVLPTVGPASAALNSFYQHPYTHMGMHGSVPAPHQQQQQQYPFTNDGGGAASYHRSASAATSAAVGGQQQQGQGAMSAIDKLRASRRPSFTGASSMARADSMGAATNLGMGVGGGGGGSMAPNHPSVNAEEDPIQAALRAEERMLRKVHARLPSVPLPPPAPAPAPAAPKAPVAVPASPPAAAEVAGNEEATSGGGGASPPPPPKAPPPPKKAPPPPPAAKAIGPASLTSTQAPSPASPTSASSASPTNTAADGPLPEGWREGKADDGRVFYFNNTTKERSWKRPTVAASAASPTSASVAASPTSADGPLLPGWKEASDPKTGKPYYYNTATRETTKVRPTASAASPTAASSPAGKLPPPPPPAGKKAAPPPPLAAPSSPAAAAGQASPWKKVEAPDGRTYYYNPTTKERSWKDPNVAAA